MVYSASALLFTATATCGSVPSKHACCSEDWCRCVLAAVSLQWKGLGCPDGSLPVRPYTHALQGWMFIPCYWGGVGERKVVSEGPDGKENLLIWWWVVLRSQTNAKECS